jgi:LPS-assembly lipoprotein
MSSFSAYFRAALLAVALSGTAALSACTGFTPVYGDRGGSEQAMALNFAAPNNELEQLVYQDLSRKFGMSSDSTAPQVSIAVSTATRALAQSQTADPAISQLLTATGVIRITRGGAPVLTATRQATATYTADSQVLADSSAQTAAGQQAAHALADTLELTIMSALAPTAPAR